MNTARTNDQFNTARTNDCLIKYRETESGVSQVD